MKRLTLVLRSVIITTGFLMFSSAIPAHSASVGSGTPTDLDCGDFGTRERAQKEFEKYDYDRHRLDRDGDGQVCEWNPSTGLWPIPLGGLGILIGRYLGKRKRFGADVVVNGIQGIVMKQSTSLDGVKRTEFDGSTILLAFFGWVPWIPVLILRDNVLPLEATPVLLLALTTGIGAALGYIVASSKENWI